jgi:hypothetical protein
VIAAPPAAGTLPITVLHPPALTWHVTGSAGGNERPVELIVRCVNGFTSDWVIVPEGTLEAAKTVLLAERRLVAQGGYGFRDANDTCTKRQFAKPLAHVLRILRARRLGS